MLSAPINVRPSHTGVVSASKLQRYPAITPGVLHQPEPQRRTLHLVAPNLRDEGVIQKPLAFTAWPTIRRFSGVQFAGKFSTGHRRFVRQHAGRVG
jgi:hypothetical protein